jgi:hypothetical protein
VLDGIGRKTLLIFCNCLAGVACIVAAFIDKDQTAAIVTLSLAGYVFVDENVSLIQIMTFKHAFLVALTYVHKKKYLV